MPKFVQACDTLSSANCNSLYICIQKLHMFLPVKSAFKPNFNCILILPGGNFYAAISPLCVHFMRARTIAIHAHAQMHFRCALRDSSLMCNCSCISGLHTQLCIFNVHQICILSTHAVEIQLSQCTFQPQPNPRGLKISASRTTKD